MKFKAGDSVKLVDIDDRVSRTVIGYEYDDDDGDAVIYEHEILGVLECHEDRLELRQPKFKAGDHVKPKAEFADMYVDKSGWQILEIDADIVKYKYRCNGWHAVDSCPISHLELEPVKTEDLVYRSEGTCANPNLTIELTSEPEPTTWTFRGDLDYVKLRDDMIEANADWAIVDDVVYVRGRIKHTMDVLGIRGAVKVCRGLWETGIYHEVARTGRFDEMLQELANRPTHTVEVFRLEEPTK